MPPAGQLAVQPHGAAPPVLEPVVVPPVASTPAGMLNLGAVLADPDALASAFSKFLKAFSPTDLTSAVAMAAPTQPMGVAMAQQVGTTPLMMVNTHLLL